MQAILRFRWNQYGRHFGRLGAALLTGLLVTAGVSVAEAEAPAAVESDAPTLAVLDFTAADMPPQQGDPSVGLADFLEVQLAQHGVVILERRRIQPLLAERRLQRQGLAVEARTPTTKLPHVTYLLHGRVEQPAPGRVELHVALVNAADNTEAHTFHTTSRYPDGWLGSLDEVAGRIAHRLGAIEAPAARPITDAAAQGFTHSPEAAMLFYKGIEHMTARQWHVALAYFREAHNRSGNHDEFTAVRMWEMRAWQQAGFPDVAEAILDSLREQDTDAAALALAAFAPQGRPEVVILTHSEQLAPATRVAFTKRLAAGGIRTLTSYTLADLAREHDLHLTGEFDSPHAAAYAPLLVDAIVWFDADHVRLYDALTGVRQGEVAIDDDGAVMAELLLQQFELFDREGRHQPDAMADADAVPRPTQLPDGTFVIQPAGTSRRDDSIREVFEGGNIELYSDLLRRLIDEPTNLDYIASMYNWTDRTAHVALIARALRMLEHHRDLPDAAAWVNVLGWQRFEKQFHGLRGPLEQRFEAEQSVSERYAELLAWFPDSPEAKLVQYARAHELLDKGEHVEALARLRAVTDALPNMKLTGNVQPTRRWRISLYYFLARELYRQGEIEAAQRYMNELSDLVETHNIHRLQPMFETGMWRRIYEAKWQFSEQPKYSHKQQYGEHLSYWKDLMPEVRALQRRLAAAEAGEPIEPDYLTSRELFRFASQSTGNEAFELQRRSIDEHLLERSEQASIPERIVLQMAWLRTRATTDERRAMVDRFVDVLAESSDDPRQLLLVAGRFDEVQQRLDGALRSRHGMVRATAILQQAEIDSLLHNPAEQAKRLLRAITAFEQDLPEEVGEPSLAFCYLVEAVGPMLLTTGATEEAARLYRRVYDRPNLPTVYKMRAAYNLARAEARCGRVFEASELLRDVVDTLSRHPHQSFEWELPPAERAALSRFRRAGIHESQELLSAANVELLDLRRLGGYEAMFRHVADHGGPTPNDVAAEMYAFLLSLNTRDTESYHRWMHKDHWANEAWTALGERGAAGGELARRLATAHFLDPQRKVLIQEQQYRAVHALSEIGPDALPSIEALMAWSRWTSICSTQRHAAHGLSQLGGEAAPAVPGLVLMSGASCPTCRRLIMYALRRIDRPEPKAVTTLIRMLDHSSASVRRNAAGALARLAEMAVPYGPDREPTEQAVREMRRWSTSADAARMIHATTTRKPAR